MDRVTSLTTMWYPIMKASLRQKAITQLVSSGRYVIVLKQDFVEVLRIDVCIHSERFHAASRRLKFCLNQFTLSV